MHVHELVLDDLCCSFGLRCALRVLVLATLVGVAEGGRSVRKETDIFGVGLVAANEQIRERRAGPHQPYFVSEGFGLCVASVI